MGSMKFLTSAGRTTSAAARRAAPAARGYGLGDRASHSEDGKQGIQITRLTLRTGKLILVGFPQNKEIKGVAAITALEFSHWHGLYYRFLRVYVKATEEPARVLQSGRDSEVRRGLCPFQNFRIMQ